MIMRLISGLSQIMSIIVGALTLTVNNIPNLCDNVNILIDNNI